jgi:hypothetical protein
MSFEAVRGSGKVAANGLGDANSSGRGRERALAGKDRVAHEVQAA